MTRTILRNVPFTTAPAAVCLVVTRARDAPGPARAPWTHGDRHHRMTANTPQPRHVSIRNPNDHPLQFAAARRTATRSPAAPTGIAYRTATRRKGNHQDVHPCPCHARGYRRCTRGNRADGWGTASSAGSGADGPGRRLQRQKPPQSTTRRTDECRGLRSVDGSSAVPRGGGCEAVTGTRHLANDGWRAR